MATPKAKAGVDPNYERQCRKLKTHAKAEHAKRSTGEQTTHYRPVGWNGDPFDYEGMSPPFNRDKANSDYEDAVKDPSAPGTTGDVVATTTMIDTLGAMERAFRVRQTLRRPRAMAHHLARQRGHGDDLGPFTQLNLEYVRAILKQAGKPSE